MAETFRERMVRNYAYQIFIDGTRTFAGTNATYHQDIKVYAAANFTDAKIQNALDKGWITQAEYDETMAIKHPIEEPPTEAAPATE